MLMNIPAGYPGGCCGDGMGYGYGNYGLGMNRYAGLTIKGASPSDFSSGNHDDTAIKILGFGALAVALGAVLLSKGKGEGEISSFFKRLFKRKPKTPDVKKAPNVKDAGAGAASNATNTAAGSGAANAGNTVGKNRHTLPTHVKWSFNKSPKVNEVRDLEADKDFLPKAPQPVETVAVAPPIVEDSVKAGVGPQVAVGSPVSEVKPTVVEKVKQVEREFKQYDDASLTTVNGVATNPQAAASFMNALPEHVEQSELTMARLDKNIEHQSLSYKNIDEKLQEIRKNGAIEMYEKYD